MKTICAINHPDNISLIECDKCKSQYCTACFDYDCPKCMEDLGNKIIARAETGVMKFGNDWPGLFIRGDNAAYFAMELKILLNFIDNGNIDSRIGLLATRTLILSLESCIEPVNVVQVLKEFDECK